MPHPFFELAGYFLSAMTGFLIALLIRFFLLQLRFKCVMRQRGRAQHWYHYLTLFISLLCMLVDLILFIGFWLYSAAFSSLLYRLSYVLVFALTILLFNWLDTRLQEAMTPLVKFLIDRNIHSGCKNRKRTFTE